MAENNYAEYPQERRSQTRDTAKDCYRAEIRLVGVPVYELKLTDLSSTGACILVKKDSLLLNHLELEQNVMVKYYLEDRSKPTEAFKAEIRHITKAKEGRFKGHYLAGLSILMDS